MTLGLDQAILAFSKIGEAMGYDTPKGALDQCFWASLGFQDFMEYAGHSCELIRVEMSFGDAQRHIPNGMSRGHILTRIGTEFYDWTYRQFDSACEFPKRCQAWELEAACWKFQLGDVFEYVQEKRVEEGFEPMDRTLSIAGWARDCRQAISSGRGV